MRRDPPGGYDRTSRALHWLTAALVLGLLPLGLWIARTPPRLDTLWLFPLHKSLGLTVLALTLLRLLWRRLRPPPPPIARGHAAWELALARGTHRALLALLVAVPLAGWAGASATGIATRVWGLPLPGLLPASAGAARVGLAVHGLLAGLLALGVALHLAGVARRVRARDGTLRRMLAGTGGPSRGLSPRRAGPAGARKE